MLREVAEKDLQDKVVKVAKLTEEEDIEAYLTPRKCIESTEKAPSEHQQRYLGGLRVLC